MRRLGAILFAVLAILGTTNVALTSAEFSSNSEVAELDGENIGVAPEFEIPGFGTVVCESTLTGVQNGPLSPSWIVEPSFQNCTKEGTSATVKAEGCLVRLVDPDEPLQLIGEPCKGIDVTSGCWHAHIDPELGGSTSYGNGVNPSGQVVVRAEVPQLDVEVGGCGFPDLEFSGGHFRAEWLVSGGVESTESTPMFRAAQVPAGITGQADGDQVLTIQEGVLRCKQLSASTWTPTNQTGTVPVTGWSNCSFSGTVPTVDFGGCTISLSSAGGFDVTGKTCAEDPITVVANGGIFGTCTLTVGPQAKSGAVSYSEYPTEEPSVVLGAIDAESLSYTVAGSLCKKTGTFTNGRYTGGVELEAELIGSGPTDLRFLS